MASPLATPGGRDSSQVSFIAKAGGHMDHHLKMVATSSPYPSHMSQKTSPSTLDSMVGTDSPLMILVDGSSGIAVIIWGGAFRERMSAR